MPRWRNRAPAGVAAPRDNLILGSLSEAAFGRLAPDLVPVDFSQGARFEGDMVDVHSRFHFVGRGAVSLVYTTADGDSTKLATIGCEGGVSLGSVLGGSVLPGERIVQFPGSGWAIDVEVVRREFVRGGSLQRGLLTFGQNLMVQVAQTAVCNRHHSVELQFIRWLLLSLDRLTGNDLVMTQEAVAEMLGVRRAGVNEAIGRLRARGVISVGRGRIRVNDRAALEDWSCQCYRVIRDYYARHSLQPGTPAADP
ncbi:MAG: Crp/Fnr family transcriptional regulator [Wenzhouxiangella sp.]